LPLTAFRTALSGAVFVVVFSSPAARLSVPALVLNIG